MHTTSRAPDRPEGGSTGRRTRAGDVILGSSGRPAGRSATDARSGRALRSAAVVLGVLAAIAVLVTGLAAANRIAAPSAAGPASQASAGSRAGSIPGTAPGGSSTPPPSRSTGSYPQRTASDPAGGIAAARSRVAAFVAALNSEDMDRANSLLCRTMFGRYDTSSLAGIKPGSLGVGGVTVRGSTGRAIVTYRPDDGGPEERTVFGLTVQHDTWMLCTPQ